MVSSPRETCEITRSKSRTYHHLAEVVPVPKIYQTPEEIADFPVFLKPDRGQGSQDTHVVRDAADLQDFVRRGLTGRLLLEYLPGEEYTIDCFSDRERGLLFCSGRVRTRTRSGIAMHSQCVQDPLFLHHARAIAGRLDFHGAWFFQMKRDRQGTLKLLEVAPRIAGTMALHRVMGVNFPLLSLFEEARRPLQVMTNSLEVEIDRALVNRYRYDLQFWTVYVDLDDTLILHGAVNTLLVRFLYQCLNRSIRLVLLTHHRGSINDTLRHFRLQSLFDDIIVLDNSETKAEHIHEPDAIFIDDSFRERQAVHRECGIPTFDGSMIEMLIDDRS